MSAYSQHDVVTVRRTVYIIGTAWNRSQGEKFGHWPRTRARSVNLMKSAIYYSIVSKDLRIRGRTLAIYS